MESRSFGIRLTRLAEKDLVKLKKRNRLAYDRATEAISRLQENPLAGHALSGDLADCRALDFTAKGSGQYRVVYTVIDFQAVCVVFYVSTRENAYVEVARRARQVLRDPLGS